MSRDTLTGFKGTATAKAQTEYIHDTPQVQVLVENTLTGDKITKEWISEPRLELISAE
jgi:hypothetical protein